MTPFGKFRFIDRQPSFHSLIAFRFVVCQHKVGGQFSLPRPLWNVRRRIFIYMLSCNGQRFKRGYDRNPDLTVTADPGLDAC